MKIRFDKLILFLFCFINMLGAFRPERAESIDVDCSTKSLIDAINAANTSGSPQTLNLVSGCLYSLTEVNNTGDRGNNGLPQISGNLTIVGNNSTIERNTQRDTPMFRMLQVNKDASLVLDGLTLSNGHNDVTHEDEEGGAIFSRGNLLITNCTIHKNLSGCGGAVYNYNNLKVTHTAFISNVANN